MSSSVILSDLPRCQEFLSRQPVDQSRFPHTGGSNQCNRLPFLQIRLQFLIPILLKRCRYEHIHSRSCRFHRHQFICQILTEIQLCEHNHRNGTALPCKCQIALQSAQIKIRIQGHTNKYRIDIGCHELFFPALSGSLAHEYTFPRQNSCDYSISLILTISVNLNIITDCREIHRSGRIISHSAGYSCEQFSCLSLNAVGIPGLRDDSRPVTSFTHVLSPLRFSPKEMVAAP